jgi:hypothetical protein
MKKIMIAIALLLFAGFAFGQKIEKGGVIGSHVWTTVKLKPGVTEEQYLEFIETKWKPAYEKHFVGVKMFTLKGLKGENEGKLGHIYYFKDEATYNKYITPDSGLTEEGITVFEKIQPVYDELLKIQEDWQSEFTDWVVLF